MQGEIAEAQSTLQEKTESISKLEEQLKNAMENVNIQKDGAIEDMKANYEQALEKKRSSKNLLKE